MKPRLIATLAAACCAAPAGADGPQLPARVLPAYRQECASCHTFYAPRMLPAESWQRIMAGLGRHHGTDASLDPQTVAQITAWLQANAAGPRHQDAPPQDRITRSAWFERKHRGIDAAVWRHPAVRSAAHCTACHPRADQSDYDDDGLRLPAGLHARLRSGQRD